jgi:hypothetical protein
MSLVKVSKTEQRLEDQIKKLKQKKTELSQKKKRFRDEKLSEIGRLTCEANIDEMDPETLLGAMLEIAKKKDNKDSLIAWKESAQQFRSVLNSESQKLIIVCGKVPDQKLKSIMKELSFRWNSFRNEFYGTGSISDLQNRISDFDCTIEVVNDY